MVRKRNMYMENIKNIIFDLGGVLLNLDMNRTLDAYKAMGIQNIEDFFRIGHAASFFKLYETGDIGDEEFIERIERLEGNTGTKKEIQEAWNALLLDFPASRVKWLKRIKSKYRLFLFSNTNALHLDHFQKSFKKDHGFDIDDLFEKAYYSHIVNCRKPDHASYRLVLNENNLYPHETAFIDDALINVLAANEVGIKGVHLEKGMEVVELFGEM